MTRQDLIDFCLTFPGAYEDYPYDKISTPGSVAVMRHGTHQKSFATVYERMGRLCVTLKCDPMGTDFAICPADFDNSLDGSRVSC
jgi:predicted DNA-binding protein (MmcQ/YjbR family)